MFVPYLPIPCLTVVYCVALIMASWCPGGLKGDMLHYSLLPQFRQNDAQVRCEVNVSFIQSTN